MKYISKPHAQPLSELTERGDKAPLYRGEVKLYFTLIRKRQFSLTVSSSTNYRNVTAF